EHVFLDVDAADLCTLCRAPGPRPLCLRLAGAGPGTLSQDDAGGPPVRAVVARLLAAPARHPGTRQRRGRRQTKIAGQTLAFSHPGKDAALPPCCRFVRVYVARPVSRVLGPLALRLAASCAAGHRRARVCAL